MPSSLPSALVVAHPGHELRVFGWVEATRPRVYILTDGSGRGGQSRLPATTRILAETGAVPAGIYGRLTDHDAYDAMLRSDHMLWVKLAEELATDLIDHGIEVVAGDAIEGYNPTHDVCRLLVNSAVELVARRTSRRIENWEFPLVGPPDSCPPGLRSRAMVLTLEREALDRKMAAAHRYSELAGEVDDALRTVGESGFGIEMLRPVVERAATDGLADEPPYYERHGERRVATGNYMRVLRRSEHVLPIADALWHWARRDAPESADSTGRTRTG